MPGPAGLVVELGLVARAGLGGLVLVTYRLLDPATRPGTSLFPIFGTRQSGLDLGFTKHAHQGGIPAKWTWYSGIECSVVIVRRI